MMISSFPTASHHHHLHNKLRHHHLTSKQLNHIIKYRVRRSSTWSSCILKHSNTFPTSNDQLLILYPLVEALILPPMVLLVSLSVNSRVGCLSVKEHERVSFH